MNTFARSTNTAGLALSTTPTAAVIATALSRTGRLTHAIPVVTSIVPVAGSAGTTTAVGAAILAVAVRGAVSRADTVATDRGGIGASAALAVTTIIAALSAVTIWSAQCRANTVVTDWSSIGADATLATATIITALPAVTIWSAHRRANTVVTDWSGLGAGAAVAAAAIIAAFPVGALALACLVRGSIRHIPFAAQPEVRKGEEKSQSKGNIPDTVHSDSPFVI